MGIQSNFGVGFLWAIPQGSNPTPTRCARLQDASVEWAWDEKPLHASYQFAVENGMGKARARVKATAGVIDPFLFNSCVFGGTLTAGETRGSVDEAAQVPNTPGPYTITNAHPSTTQLDLGVYNQTTGVWMQRVAAGPTSGQYSVNIGTGVYTFHSSAQLQNVTLNYTYAQSNTGWSLLYTNQLMGTGPVFRLSFYTKYKQGDGVTRSLYLNFPAVQCPKLSMPLKLDDWSLPAMEFAVQDDSSGNIYNYSATT